MFDFTRYVFICCLGQSALVRSNPTVQGVEPRGIPEPLLLLLALQLHHVPVPGVLVAGVAQRNLRLRLGNDSQRLQMGVESGHLLERDLEQHLGEVAHGHIVRQTDIVGQLLEGTVHDPGAHELDQRTAEAEAGSACCEPKSHLALLGEEELLEAKAAVWGVASVAASSAAATLLEQRGALAALINLAETCPVVSLRGTAYYALGLVATARPGAVALGQKHCAAYSRQAPRFY